MINNKFIIVALFLQIFAGYANEAHQQAESDAVYLLEEEW
jgi:hypothetical protein